MITDDEDSESSNHSTTTVTHKNTRTSQGRKIIKPIARSAHKPQEQSKIERPLKVAPITVTKSTTFSTKALCDLVAQNQFLIKNISIGQKIMPKTTEAFDKIIAALKGNNVEYFTHPTPQMKIFRSVCKGLCDVPEEDIAEELQSEYGVRPVNVNKFGKNPNNMIFLIDFKQEDMNKEKIKSIRSILCQIVTWEKFAPKKNRVKQCNRCHTDMARNG